MEKPLFLYHGSQNKNIRLFEPRAESIRDPTEGNVVFATPHIEYASMFIVSTSDSWTSQGRFNELWYIAISDKNRFLESDNGGAIYSLPSETFETDFSKGMKSSEWISKTPVKPVSKTEYAKGLEAMLAHNINIFFVDDAMFTEFRTLLHSNQIKEAFTLLFAQPPYTG